MAGRQLWTWDPTLEHECLLNGFHKDYEIVDIRKVVKYGYMTSLAKHCWDTYKIVTEPKLNNIYECLVGIAQIYKTYEEQELQIPQKNNEENL